MVVALAGLLVWRQMSNRGEAVDFDRAAAAAGCGEVRELGDLSQEHINDKAITYETSPPAGGAHQDGVVAAGAYDIPLSADSTKQPNIYQAVHSQEHGYVIVWHNGLTEKEADAISRTVDPEDEVISVPYSKLRKGQKMALTAWGRIQFCEKASAQMIDAFVDRYRNARSAPEASIP